MPMIPAWGLSLLIAGGGTGLQLLLAPRPPKQQPVDIGKFDDVRIQGADYGAFIPRIWGTARVAGNLIFSNGIQHYVIDEPTSGGKGVPQAPATRRHVYQSSFGILVCRGPIISYLRTWEDADPWVGGVNPNEVYIPIECEDTANYTTLNGTASLATVDGVTFVRNLGGSGNYIEFDFTSITPPPNPYDPEDNAQPYTFIEVYYNSNVDANLDFGWDNGTSSGTVSRNILLSGGEWTVEGLPAFDGFLESLTIGGPSALGNNFKIDYIYIRYIWFVPTASLPIPFHRENITGIINPNIAYPPNLDNPSPYYNYPAESVKDGDGVYNIETSIPGDVYRWYTGTSTQAADPIIQEWLDARYGTGEGILRASAMRGLAYTMFGNKTLRQARPANYTFEVYSGPEDVNDILDDLCDDVGIGSGDRNFTATAGLTQVGFLESTNSSRASLFDQLQRYHLFRRAEIDGKIKTIIHAFTPVYTVDVDSMRAHDDGEEMPVFDAEVVCAEEHLLPREMRFSVMNPQRDYHNETATAQLFTVPGTESEEYGFNIVDSLDSCRLQVEKALLKVHSEAQAIEFFAMPELAQYSVGDVITVPINGLPINMRIEKKQMTLPIGKIRIQGVKVTPFTPTAYQAETTTTVNLAREQVAPFNYPRNSVVVVIPSVPIREADRGKLGVYLAPCGRGFGAGENIAVYREFGDENYIIQFVADTPANVGLCEDVLGTHSDSSAKDTTNTLDIWFFDSVELENVSTADIDRYPNLNLLRVGNEWLQFETATAQVLETNSPYRSKWRVSNLWRGRFNTAGFMASHAADEYAVHATHALRYYELEEEDIGQEIALKAVTGGQAIDLAPIATFIFNPLFDGSECRTFSDHLAGYTTTGTSTEDAYIDLLSAGTFARDGDKLVIRAHGLTASNSNSKAVLFDFGGTTLITATSNGVGTQWELNITLMRIDSQAISYGCEFAIDGEAPTLDVSQVLGLDLDNDDYEMKLQLRSPDNAGDVSTRMAHYIFHPAATGSELLLGGGVPLQGGGEYLIG